MNTTDQLSQNRRILEAIKPSEASGGPSKMLDDQLRTEVEKLRGDIGSLASKIENMVLTSERAQQKPKTTRAPRKKKEPLTGQEKLNKLAGGANEIAKVEALIEQVPTRMVDFTPPTIDSAVPSVKKRTLGKGLQSYNETIKLVKQEIAAKDPTLTKAQVLDKAREEMRNQKACKK